MKKFTAIAAFVLTMALVLCSLLVPATTTATGSTSNWAMGGGSTVTDETTEIWVVDTITASLPGVNGYIQHTEQMKELVGTDGKDGKGYVNVLVEDGTAELNRDNGYFKVMLVGKSDPAQAIDRVTGTDKAVIWSFRGDGKIDTNLDAGQIANAAQNAGTAYGKHEDIVAAGGYRVVFSRNADNKAMIRGIGNGAGSDAIQYAKNRFSSDMALTDIAGDNGETAADGVYLRIHTGCSSVALKVTVTVAYPMPADFDATQTPNSRWAMGGGSSVVDATTEYLAVDTVKVSMPQVNGYIQHKEQLTDLIGSDGKDGKGFVNVIVGDGTTATSATCYFAMMLVGKADATIAIPNNTVNDQAITWYLRPDGNGTTQTQGRICNTVANAACEYGAWDNFGAEGFRMAFTKNTDDTVSVRGIGNGVFHDVTKYSKSVKLATKLTDIEGDNGETAADGVYLRLHTRRSSAPLDLTVTVAYPCEAPTGSAPSGAPSETPSETPTATPTGPVNLVPEDLFASKTNAQQWFGGTLPGTFTEEDGEYVYKATTALNGIYTTHALPDGSFTVKMNIKPTEYVNGQNAQAYSGMGILLGTSAGGNAVPWMNIRFDANYTTKKMEFYVWEKTADNRDIVAKKYGTDWYEGEFPEDMWFEVIMEFTPTETKIYLDGYQTPFLTTGYTPPTDSLGHFPTADEIKFIGLFPSGAEYSIKNFEVYEGVGLGLGALAPSTPNPTPNQPTGDNSMALIAMAMVLSAGAFVVMTKRRSYAK